LDAAKIDTITADVVSTSDPLGIQVPLEESELNSGLFTGTFTITSGASSDNAIHLGSGDSLGVVYDPPLAFAGRLEMTIPESSIITGGSVKLSDEPITSNDELNNGFGAVIDSVKVELVDATVGVAGTATITMSYANAVILLPDEFPVDQLCLLHQKNPEEAWEILTGPASLDPEDPNVVAHNLEARTVTNVLQPGGQFDDLSFHPEGRYVLAFSCYTGSGGGGGGLIRPGLVLNILAGLNLGGGGLDVNPPSLHFGTPTNSQDGFGGILVTDDNNSFPLVINGKGYYLPAFSTTIEPVQVNTGEDVDLTLTFLEYTGVEHVAIHFVNENNDDISDTDAVITYHNGYVTKVDPEGILGDDITFSKTKDGNKYSFNFGFSFDEPTNRHLIIPVWDDKKNSESPRVYNAFAVSGDSIPDDGTSHMIYLDLGAYFITADGIFAAGEKPDEVGQPVIEYDYPDYVGRMERHDGIMYDQIADEKAKANQVMAEKFNLDTQTFVANDEEKPYDMSRRASELDLPYVGHKLRDFTLSPEENGKLLKELSWKEHLKAQKLLDSLLVSSKYHK